MGGSQPQASAFGHHLRLFEQHMLTVSSIALLFVEDLAWSRRVGQSFDQ